MKKILPVIVAFLGLLWSSNSALASCNFQITLLQSGTNITRYTDSVNITVNVQQSDPSCQGAGILFAEKPHVGFLATELKKDGSVGVPGEPKSGSLEVTTASGISTYPYIFKVSDVIGTENIFNNDAGIRLVGRINFNTQDGDGKNIESNPLCIAIGTGTCTSGAPPTDGKSIQLIANNNSYQVGVDQIKFNVTGMIPFSTGEISALSTSTGATFTRSITADRNGFANTDDNPIQPTSDIIADDWKARLNSNGQFSNEVLFSIGKAKGYLGGGPTSGPSSGSGTNESQNIGFKLDNPMSVGSLEDLVNLIGNYIFNISIPIAVIVILYGGVMMLLGGYEPKYFNTGKTALTNAVIGLAVIFIGKGFVSLIKSFLSLKSGG